ncbi:hypothetical protein AB0H34_33780 [Saccharopolyspora shandongensis]
MSALTGLSLGAAPATAERRDNSRTDANAGTHADHDGDRTHY